MINWLEWLLSFVLKYLCIYIIVWFGVYLESKLLIIFIFFVEIQAYYSTTNLFTYNAEKMGAEHSSLPQSIRVMIITRDELVIGPLSLGITFEFWENLVVRYL